MSIKTFLINTFSHSEKKNLALIKLNNELKEKLEGQKADQADIYYYLHKKLDDNYDVISKLEAELLDMRQKMATRESDFGAYNRPVHDTNDT